MMNSKKYNGWFGIPCKGTVSSHNVFRSPIYSESKESVKKNKGFLSKKRQSEIISQIKDLLKDSKQDLRKSHSRHALTPTKRHRNLSNLTHDILTNYYTSKCHNKENQNMENKNIQPKKACFECEIIDLNYFEKPRLSVLKEEEKEKKEKKVKENNKEKMRHIVFSVNNKDGLVKYNGISSKNMINNPKDKKFNYCVYLRTKNDFNPEVGKYEYKWTVKILNKTHFIGVGLADKEIVMKNKNKFFSRNKSFYNGVFCLYSIHRHEINENQIFLWHPSDTNLNNYVVNFPPFEVGQEITMIYNTVYKNLIFVSKFKNNKKCNFIMQNVYSIGNSGKKTLTPCIIFYYPGDGIQISSLKVKSQK